MADVYNKTQEEMKYAMSRVAKEIVRKDISPRVSLVRRQSMIGRSPRLQWSPFREEPLALS